MVNIWSAVEREDLGTIQRYADSGGDLEVGSEIWGRTPLYHAAELRKKESYRKLLELGASPNTLCRRGVPVIQYAAARDDPYWLRLALQAGGDPNVFNNRGVGHARSVPLVWAIYFGTLDNVKALVEHGADIDAADEYGFTVLRHAKDANRFEIVYYLLQQGADYRKPARPTFTFLFAMKFNTPEFLGPSAEQDRKWYEMVRDWLAERNADPDQIKWDGYQPVFEGEGSR